MRQKTKDDRRLAGIPQTALPLLFAAVLAASCALSSGDEDLVSPEAPRMLEKTCPGGSEYPFPERGMDAAEDNQGIRIEWDLEPIPDDLSGFEIYRSEHPDSQFILLDEDPEGFIVGDPEYYVFDDFDSELLPLGSICGERAWYYVRALDSSGNRSQPSDTATYLLWAPPAISPSWVQVLNDTLDVSWQVGFFDDERFIGFHVLIADPQQSGLAWFREVSADLQPTMHRRWDLQGIGLPPGQWTLRVDAIISADSTALGLPSNPEECSLSGSESIWISFTF